MVRGILVTTSGQWLDFDYEKHNLAETIAMKLAGALEKQMLIGCKLMEQYTEVGYWIRIFFVVTATDENMPINKTATKLWGKGVVKGPIALVNEEYVQPTDFENDDLELLLKVCSQIPIKTSQEQQDTLQQRPGLYNDVGMARNRKPSLQQLAAERVLGGYGCANQACPMPAVAQSAEDSKRTGKSAKSKGSAAVAGALSPQLMTCSQCYRAEYCSRDCQVAHWAVHKKTCPKIPIDKLEEDTLVCVRAGLR